MIAMSTLTAAAITMPTVLLEEAIIMTERAARPKQISDDVIRPKDTNSE